MSPSILTKIAIAGVAALSIAAPVNAFASTTAAAHHHPAKAAGSQLGKKHPVKKHPVKKHPVKPAPARFTVVGVVTAVDPVSGGVSMNDKGGSPDLHGHTVVVTVGAATKMTRDDAAATLAQIQVGDQVAANGTRGPAGILNAAHFNATSAPSAQPTSTATATAQPTASAAPTP